MAEISRFKANLAGGGARPNQFRVSFANPSMGAGLDLQVASLLCKSAALPASVVEDITTFYRGRPVHFAGERTFQPWTVTIYNDNNFSIRNAFEEWSRKLVGYDATDGTLDPAQYYAQLVVEQLDRNDLTMKTYVLYDAYPTTVGQIALDYESNNVIETFEVEFVYNYFINQ